MDKPSELLIRSTLHDVANVLAGIRGIIDLNSPGEPLTSRDRDRLEAVIEEGMATLERSRHLAMGSLPSTAPEAFATWREQLLEQLRPMATIFKRAVEVSMDGADAPWPGESLRGYIRAVTRQVLPYVRTGQLVIQCSAQAQEWQVRWQGVSAIPENLLPAPEDRQRDIASRWAIRVAASQDIHLALEEGALVARIPR